MNSKEIVFQVNEAKVKGYLALPDQPRGGIIVLHAWWGLTPFIKQFCDRLATAGFAAFAPDMFDGKTASTIPEAEAMGTERSHDRVPAIVEASVDQFRAQAHITGKLGAIGFSFGGAWSLILSKMKPDDIGAVALFYGSYPGFEVKGATAAYQGHFAEHDEWDEPQEAVLKMEADIKSNGLSTDFHFYPKVGHWFFEDNRSDAYNAEAAQLAWQRTIDFINQHLASHR